MSDAPSKTLRNFRIVLWVLVAIVAAGATALYFLRPPAQPIGLNGQPFTLTATTGETFTQDDLRGQPTLMFFGFTNCPDVCPTTLSDIEVWKSQLSLDDDDLRVLFVTVDPARDTVEGLRGYLSGWSDGVVGLVGTEEETQRVKQAFGVFSEQVGEGEFYTVNHTASVFMLDADGAFRGTIAYDEPTETAVAKVERLVRG